MVGGPRLALQCGAPTVLGSVELERFRSSPWADDGLARHVWCALQNHRHGPHMAYLQQYQDVEPAAWWLVWDETERDWQSWTTCHAHRGGPDYDLCQLPADHPGHHSWLLARHRATTGM